MRLLVSLLRISGALAGAAVLGWALTLRVRRGLARAESLAWSFAAGLLAVAGVEGIFLLVGRAPRAGSIWPAVLLLAILLFVRLRYPAEVRPSPIPLSTLERVAWIACLVPVAVYAVEALSEPAWTYDFLSIWGFKAKTIYFSSSIPSRLFHDPDTLWSHPQYPILLPLIFAALSALAGSWDDQALALVYPMLQVAILLALFGFFRRRGRARAAAAAILLAAFFVKLFESDLVGLAEVPLAFAFLLLGQAYLDLRESPTMRTVGRLLLASILCSGFKKEGAVFALLLGAFLVAETLRDRAPLRWRGCAALLAPPLAQSLLLLIARGAVPERDYEIPRALAAFLPVLAERARIVAEFALGHFLRDNFVALSAIAAYFLLTRRGGHEALLPPLFLQLAIYAAAPLFTTWSDPTLLFRYTFPRLAGTLFPFFLLVLAGRRAASGTFLLRNRAAGPTME